jgi:hypothetical protein
MGSSGGERGMSESVGRGRAGVLEGLVWRGERGMSEFVSHGRVGFLEGLFWRGVRDVSLLDVGE